MYADGGLGWGDIYLLAAFCYMSMKDLLSREYAANGPVTATRLFSKEMYREFFKEFPQKYAEKLAGFHMHSNNFADAWREIYGK